MFAFYSKSLPVNFPQPRTQFTRRGGRTFRSYMASITQRQFVPSLPFGSLARANSKIPGSKELIRKAGTDEKELRKLS
jgi:hypothetical protein